MKRSLVIVFLVLLFPSLSLAQATTMELGVRGGVDGSILKESYSALEVYYLQALPWEKVISPSTRVYTRFDAGAGYLDAASDEGGWLAVGADVVLSMMEGSLELEGGFRPAWMAESRFGQDNFGGPLQFSTHAGLTLNMGRVALGYRFQHISNANIYHENPGLNLHLLGLGVRF